MMGLSLSRRARMALMVVFLLGLLLFFPLRLAAGLAGTERMGISARDVRGSIWGGRIDQLMLGRLPMGSVRVALTPEALLLGRARFDIWRRVGQADDVAGAMNVGVGRIGLDDGTGSLPIGRAFAPLPIGRLDMEGEVGRAHV